MNAPVTRRALLGATAAVGAAALPAIAGAGTRPTDADEALLGLIARHAEADDALCQAEDEVDRLFWVACDAAPARPALLRWTPEDFPRTSYGMGASDPEGDDGARIYGHRGVEWLRRLNEPACWTAECEQRRAEILSTFDAWKFGCRAVDRRVGLVAAEERREALNEALAALTAAILATPPVTIAGLAAKATWAAPNDMPDRAVAGPLRQIVTDAVAMAERSRVAS